MITSEMSTLFFSVKTMPFGDVSTVTSQTNLFIPQWTNLDSPAPKDVVCFVGSADNLESDILSFYGGGGTQCQAANGCGVHVHEGTDCSSVETQGKQYTI